MCGGMTKKRRCFVACLLSFDRDGVQAASLFYLPKFSMDFVCVCVWGDGVWLNFRVTPPPLGRFATSALRSRLFIFSCPDHVILSFAVFIFSIFKTCRNKLVVPYSYP